MVESQVIERPILFSGAMVRAILEDRKTQTRRVAKAIHELADKHESVRVRPGVDKVNVSRQAMYTPTVREHFEAACPYGKPGDRLWVRETWATDKECSAVAYRADLPPDAMVDENWLKRNAPKLRQEYKEWRWRPSIHMPRWASRLTLEIVKVRVERVQEISEADAIAEGVSLSFSDMYWQGGSSWTDERNPAFDPKRAITGPRAAYGMLWDSINSKRGFGWDKNPWVWCLTFKKVSVPSAG